VNLCFLNDLELDKISDLVDFAVDGRRLYAFHFKNGRGFIVGGKKVEPEQIRGMVADPHGLKPHLCGEKGVYTKLEKGFLLCCAAVCQSRTGGATLFSFLTGRPRDGVTCQSLKLEWLPSLPK